MGPEPAPTYCPRRAPDNRERKPRYSTFPSRTGTCRRQGGGADVEAEGTVGVELGVVEELVAGARRGKAVSLRA